ncbi:MAG: hypothetical protein ACAH95_15655 [Fimbriimonas sp.]
MANNFIYVIEGGAHDYSRWLNISLRPRGIAMLHLSDLCHPGMLSNLTTAACDLDVLQTSLATGAMQITLSNGYLLAKRVDGLLEIEFKGHDDTSPCRVTLKVDEVEKRLEELKNQLAAAAV